MKIERIKIVRRIGMPETNSSSSHAVSISMNPGNLVSPGDSDWDIEITEDGILKIPGGKNFGWDYFKTNSVLTKLQYLCGIFCYDIRTDHGKKSIVKLKRILRSVFGVKDVEFEWITKFSKRLKEVDDPEDAYYDSPEIDHNSHDIFEEITESIGTIRAFLLSRDSWLYGGNDNSEAPEGFYLEPISTNKVDAIISIDIGGEYGRIDWEITNFIDRVGQDVIRRTLAIEDEFNILGDLYYDTENKIWISGNKIELKDLMKENILTLFNYQVYKENQKIFILYTNRTFSELWSKLKKQRLESKSNIFDSRFTDLNNTIKEIMSKTKENVDYIRVPLKIKLLDYNNYEF